MQRHRTIVLQALLFAHLGLFGQAMSVTFSAQFNGQYTSLDSILVMNLTQGGDTVLYAPDTVLVLNTSTGFGGISVDGIARLELRPNRPNPFTERTTFEVNLPEAGILILGATDVLGRDQASYRNKLPSGMHRFTFTGGGLGAPCFLWAEANGQRRSMSMVDLGNTQHGTSSIVYDGPAPSATVTKDERSLFTWSVNDELRYIGYATLSPGLLLGAAIEEIPAVDVTHTFTLRNGLPCTDSPFVTDIDGNLYRTVQIGTQCWTARNLITNSYSNGDPIPEEENDVLWEDLTTGAWCYYANNSNNEALYGKLYNWYAVTDPRNVCPAGWHVPTDAEFTVLTDHLGGTLVAGGKLKGTSTLWSPPNADATNESGFSGQPGGFRYEWGDFSSLGGMGTWWSATASDPFNAWQFSMFSAITTAGLSFQLMPIGSSVRCVKDP